MTEYGSIYFSIIMLTEYATIIVLIILYIYLFNLVYIITLLVLLVYVSNIRASLNRLKYDELMTYGWTIILPFIFIILIYSITII